MTIGRQEFGKRPRCFLKLFCTWSPEERVLRLGRLVWDRGRIGDGKGYSAKVSLALAPRLLSWSREYWGLVVTFLGVRLHYQRSYGGALT